MSKYSKTLSVLIKSVLSGSLVSIASKCYVSCDNKYIGSMLFAIGLLTIIELNLRLFTGDIKSLDRHNIGQLALVLLGNFIGAQAFLFWQADTTALIAAKLAASPMQVLLKSVGCGILMAVATMARKPLFSIMCISVFVLSGFEHSIANMCYFAGVFSMQTLKFFVFNILGNSIGAIAFYRLCGLARKLETVTE